MAIRHIYCVLMLSCGSEILCNDEFKNLKTSYSAYDVLAQSFQAVLAKIRGTLRRRCRQQFAFSIPWCNYRACNSDDLSQTKTLHHEVDNVPYLAVAAFGKGYQTVS
jgi:hypothetical protein